VKSFKPLGFWGVFVLLGGVVLYLWGWFGMEVLGFLVAWELFNPEQKKTAPGWKKVRDEENPSSKERSALKARPRKKRRPSLGPMPGCTERPA